MAIRRPGKTTSALVAQYVEQHGRLGFGSMTNASTEQWVSRVTLFHLTNDSWPKQLFGFRSEAMPLYKALFGLGRTQRPDNRSDLPDLIITCRIAGNRQLTKSHLVNNWSTLCFAADHVGVAKALKTVVTNFADSWNLNTPWFLDAAIFNLRCWHLYAGEGPPPEWSYPGSLQAGPRETFGSDESLMFGAIKRLSRSGSPPPTIPVYNPASQSRDEHRAAVMKDLNEYYSAQTTRFAAAGFREAPEKRRRAGDRLQHMRWFIRFQIRGQSYEQIRFKKTGKSLTVAAIRSAVQAISKSLPIDLRSTTSKGRKKL